MKDYKYKEHEYAATILNEGFQTRRFGREVRIVAVYCREVLGLRRDQCKQRLINLCEKYMDGFNYAKHYGMINYALKQAYVKKVQLLTVDDIPIYEGEITYIDSLSVGRDCKRVLLAMLVTHKLNKAVAELHGAENYTNICFGGGKSKYRELKTMSNIPPNVNISSQIIHELGERRLVNILHNGLISMDFIYNTSQTGEVAIRITDFSNVGLYYDKIHGDKRVKECCLCGGLYKPKTNNQRYCCGSCSAKANISKTSERRKANQKIVFDSENTLNPALQADSQPSK